MHDHTRQPRPDDEFPPELISDLRAIYRTDVNVPRAIDEAILRAGKEGAARRSRFRPVARWALAGTGAAAAAAVVLVGFRLAGPGDRAAGPQAVRVSPGAGSADVAVAREDVDRNGRVDILDAFVVAKTLDARSAASPSWDVNNDGRVNGADVGQIAAAAVRVEPEGGTLQ